MTDADKITPNQPQVQGQSPQQQVEDALFGLIVGALQNQFHPTRETDAIHGFVLAFLMEYPAIHNALAAANLLKGNT